MGDFNFLSSKVLDPGAADVLSILTASLQDPAALLSTINSVVNRCSSKVVCSLPSESKAELDRLRLMLKIKHHLERNSAVDLHVTAGDGAHFKNLAKHCVAALHELVQSNSENSAGIFTTICDILGLCLLTMPSSLYNKTVINILNRTKDDYSLPASGDEKLVGGKAMVHLKVLETLIDVSIILKENDLDQAGLSKYFKDSTEEIDNFLLDTICFGERTLAAQILLSIVPKIIALVNRNEILVKIWEQIAMFNGFNTIVALPRVIFVLVSLADYFLPSTPPAISFDLQTDTKFWKILALGLASDDGLLWKQVLYIAKRADAGKTDQAVVGGNAEARRALWSRFLVVVETLEEKQSHLAHAVLPRAERVLPPAHAINSAGNPTQLAHPYALVVFRRLLRHDQPGVSKWGALRFLRSDVHALCYENSETDTSSVLRLAVSTLNTSYMFASAADGQPATEVLAALASWVPSATFSRLLHAVAAQAWNPCALLHVAHALGMAQSRQVLRCGDVELLCALATSALSTSGASVRAAVHCRLLSALANLSDPAALGLAPVLAALGALDRLALARGAGSWRQATAWLREIADAPDAEAFVACAVRAVLHGDPGSPSESSLARGIVLLLDAGLVDPALGPVRDGLRTALAHLLARAYAGTDVQDRALVLLAWMLEEAAQIHPGFADRYLDMDDAILSLVRDFRNDAVDAIVKRLAEISDLREFAISDDYVFALKQLLPCLEQRELDRLWKTASTAASLETSPAIRQYLALKLLATMSPPPNLPLATCPDVSPPPGLLLAGRTCLATPSEHLAGLLLPGSMNLAPTREPSANRDVAVLHGRLVSGCLSARWELLCCQLAAAAPPPDEVLACLEDCIDCLQLCAGAATPHVAHALSLVWPSVAAGHRTLALEALDAVWTAALDSRRTEAFWPTIRSAVATAFHPLLIGQAWAQPHLNSFALALVELAQSVVGLANVLFERLASVADGDNLQAMHAVIVSGLLFGPTHRKDQRFEEETVALIKSLGASCSVNEISQPVVSVDAKVRAMSVNLLLRATSRQTGTGRKVWRHEACAQLALALVERHDAITRRNQRYFADSTQHRLRHRTLQGLLLIAGGLDQPTSTTLLSWCWRCLALSSHQRSVRCQLEWLAARLTLAWPSNHGTAPQGMTNRRIPCLGPAQFDATAVNDGTVSPQASGPDGDSQKLESIGPALACSALVVAALVGRCSCTEDDLGAGMELALASLVAQHFNQRLHAQVVFCSLWDASTRAGFTLLLERFTAVNSALRSQPLVATGNAQRNVQRMHADFFLTQLDALEHVSVLSVCRDVPRLTGCPERLEAEELQASDLEGALPLRCRNEAVHVAAQGVLGGVAPEEEPLGDARDPQDPNDNEAEADVQRKPTPEGADPRCQRRDDGVVLVASLIDKPANLGGLCRSCDVFGASLVVPKLALVQDKAFVALSVSSQRWVPVSEVRAQDLQPYLVEMKRKGYTLVGAEQTAGSVAVQHARFPSKTLLLLGNEKEGIPANLLPFLDTCVEIPQHGVIRSLNVHVTGAICLWEISRQHHLGIVPAS